MSKKPHEPSFPLSHALGTDSCRRGEWEPTIDRAEFEREAAMWKRGYAACYIHTHTHTRTDEKLAKTRDRSAVTARLVSKLQEQLLRHKRENDITSRRTDKKMLYNTHIDVVCVRKIRLFDDVNEDSMKFAIWSKLNRLKEIVWLEMSVFFFWRIFWVSSVRTTMQQHNNNNNKTTGSGSRKCQWDGAAGQTLVLSKFLFRAVSICRRRPLSTEKFTI